MSESMRLFVSEGDRQEAAKWLRASNTRRSHAERAGIVLLSAEGLTAEAIRRYIDTPNLATAKPFVSTKSAESILAAVDRAKRSIATNQTGH
jgi:hypothetical protein